MTGGLVRRIEHIAVAVKNVEASARLFKVLLGTTCGPIETLSDERVKVAFFELGCSGPHGGRRSSTPLRRWRSCRAARGPRYGRTSRRPTPLTGRAPHGSEGDRILRWPSPRHRTPGR